MSSHRSHGDSGVRRGHVKEADGSQTSAWAAIPSSASATPDVCVARDKASHATTPPPRAAAPSPTAGVSSVPSAPSVGSNLSIPSKSVGQVASPGTVTQFTVACLIQVIDMLRRLDERAKAEAQTSASVAGPETSENHGADRAGSPTNHGPLGTPASDRRAPLDQGEEQIEPSR